MAITIVVGNFKGGVGKTKVSVMAILGAGLRTK